MDNLLKPHVLQAEPSTPNAKKIFSHWLRIFQNFLNYASERENFDKLSLLINHISTSIFDHVVDCSTYDEAIKKLKNMYERPTSELFARYTLISCTQKPGETLVQYMNTLKQLGNDCNFTAVSAAKNRDDFIRDVFITGISSSSIRQNLLESKYLTIEDTFDKAHSLEQAQTIVETFCFPHGLATSNSTNDIYQDVHLTNTLSDKKCINCARFLPLSQCSNSTNLCYKCKTEEIIPQADDRNVEITSTPKAGLAGEAVQDGSSSFFPPRQMVCDLSTVIYLSEELDEKPDIGAIMCEGIDLDEPLIENEHNEENVTVKEESFSQDKQNGTMFSSQERAHKNNSNDSTEIEKKYSPDGNEMDTQELNSMLMNDSMQNIIFKRDIVKLYRCNLCSESFPCKLDLLVHLKIHAKNDRTRSGGEGSVMKNTEDLSSNAFRCDICDASFARQSNFTVHLKKRHNIEKTTISEIDESATEKEIIKNPFECQTCNASFTCHYILKSHMKKRHSIEDTSISEVNDPTLKKEIVKKLECTVCDASFFRQSNLTAHQKKRHSIEKTFNNENTTDKDREVTKQFKCNSCNASFIRHYNLTVHQKKRHSFEEKSSNETHESEKEIVKKPFECEVCNGSFSCQSSLNAHQKKRHSIEKTSTNEIDEPAIKTDIVKKLECKFCDASYFRQSNLTVHQKRRHSIEKKSSGGIEMSVMKKKILKYLLKCNTCNRRFYRQCDLTVHKKKCHGIQKKSSSKIKKSERGKNIFKKSNLKIHKSNHIGIKKSDKNNDLVSSLKPCEVSLSNSDVTENDEQLSVETQINSDDKSTNSNSSNVDTENQPTKNFSCSHCSKSFSSIKSLKVHSKLHKDGMQLSCTICSKKFSNNFKLQFHQKLHSKPKKFSCTVCSKTFHVKYLLLRHLRTHVKSFPCTICSTSFPSGYALNCHYVKVHNAGNEYTCSICSKTFVTKSGLNRHCKMHIPVSCPVCSETLKNRSALPSHMKKHGTYKTKFGCPICSKYFRDNYHLKRHSEQHARARSTTSPIRLKTFSNKVDQPSELHTDEK